MLLRVSIDSPNVKAPDEAALSAVCNWTTVGILKLVVPYFVSPSWMLSAVSPQAGWVNSSCFICFGRNAQSDAITLWILYPSPSRVRHLCSVYLPEDLLHHHSCHHYPRHCRNMRGHSNYHRWHSPSSQVMSQALWLAILHFQHFSYLLPSAWLLSLCLQLTYLPQRSLYPHNPRPISLLLLLCNHTVLTLIRVWQDPDIPSTSGQAGLLAELPPRYPSHFSFSSSLEKCMSCHFPTARFFLYR